MFAAQVCNSTIITGTS